MENLKTIAEWIDQLPSDLKDKAIDNCHKQGYQHRLDWTFEGGITALTMAFDFKETPEGNSYWLEVISKNFKPAFTHG